jgi:hypothetical protein
MGGSGIPALSGPMELPCLPRVLFNHSSHITSLVIASLCENPVSTAGPPATLGSTPSSYPICRMYNPKFRQIEWEDAIGDSACIETSKFGIFFFLPFISLLLCKGIADD